MKITLGFSPCPNDTYIFAAMVNGWIDTHGLSFDVSMEDVETLNEMADKEELDITKLSFHKSLYLEDRYLLLQSGAALGLGCGPLLIARSHLEPNDINSGKIALPGQWTTAHLLFKVFFPHALHKEFHLFSTIEDLVLSGQVDAGVIIHENRFTYEAKGLVKIMDLGEAWETETGLPIPLGGIFSSIRLGPPVRTQVQNLIRDSIQYAHKHPQQVMEYVRCYSQDMDEAVMMSHIALYVNAFSLDLGPEGRESVSFLKKYLRV